MLRFVLALAGLILVILSGLLLVMRRAPSEAAWIAFVSNRTGSYNLYIMDPNGHHVRAVTQGDGVTVSEPTWSPDGKWLAFIGIVKRNNGLYMVRANGQDFVRLSDEMYWEDDPQWLADGKVLIFRAYYDNAWHIFQVDPTTFQISPYPATGINWIKPKRIQSADGRWSAPTKIITEGNSDVYRVENITQETTRLTDFKGFDKDAAWSPYVDSPWAGGILFVTGMLGLIGGVGWLRFHLAHEPRRI